MCFKTCLTVCVALLGIVAAIDDGEGQKQQVRILTLGHTDHGMETVTTAILKRQASKQLAQHGNLVEIVKARPFADSSKSVKIMRAEVTFETGKRKYSHFQCRYHADYLKELIAGPNRFDGAVLVVSAADGPMWQTREQIRMARKVGIPALVVFLDKCNLVDDKELLQLIEWETRELLTKLGYPGDKVAFVQGSSFLANDNPDDAAKMKCIDDLLIAMDESIPAGRSEVPPRPSMDSGTFQAEIYCLPSNEGGRKMALRSGDQATFQFTTSSTRMGRVRSVTKDEWLPGEIETVFGTFGQWVTKDECLPGDFAAVSVDFDAPVPLESGQRFLVQEENRTVAVGVVTGIDASSK